jgi:Rad3-related DNA helicase
MKNLIKNKLYFSVNFARIVPNGMLIFFPSYPVMDKCIEYWKVGKMYGIKTV